MKWKKSEDRGNEIQHLNCSLRAVSWTSFFLIEKKQDQDNARRQKKSDGRLFFFKIISRSKKKGRNELMRTFHSTQK